MRANLHLHSRFSDGTDWPAEIAARAAAAGLALAAVTDHDTLGGVREFAEAAAARGLATVPGVEMDCRAPGLDYRSELLAYFPSGGYSRTADFLAEICADRLRIAKEAVSRARKVFGLPGLSFEALLDRKRADRGAMPARAFSFNKVDVFRYLRDEVGAAVPADYRAFKKAYYETRLLVRGSHEKPSCEEVCRVVRSDGGLVVVPHLGHEFGDDPARLKKERKRLRGLLDYFRSIGAAGVELYWYRNGGTAALNKIVAAEAAERGMFVTYGSDCHGPGSGKETMGAFDGDFAGFPAETGKA